MLKKYKLQLLYDLCKRQPDGRFTLRSTKFKKNRGMQQIILIRTEGMYVGVMRMLSQLVGFGPVERLFMTRAEGISVGVVRMLCQLVGFGPVERLNVKFTKNVYC